MYSLMAVWCGTAKIVSLIRPACRCVKTKCAGSVMFFSVVVVVSLRWYDGSGVVLGGLWGCRIDKLELDSLW